MNPAPVLPQPRRRAPFRASLGFRLTLIAGIVILMWVVTDFGGYLHAWKRARHMTEVQRSVEGNNLRNIGQAMLAAENDHPGVPSFDNLSDIYALAAQLARTNGPTEVGRWLSEFDEIFPLLSDYRQFVVEPAPAADGIRPINPKFQGLPLAFAVALFPPGTLLDNLPAPTPLAWTRGLQSDGKWSKTLAPYGDWGGFIIFADGNLERYETIGGKLVKFSTTQPTSDIREALPPGTRISEFSPKPRSR